MNSNPLDHQSALQEWREKEKQALELSKLVGELRFDRSIEIVLFRRDLFDIRPSEIINIHLFSKNYINTPITVELTLSIVKVIYQTTELNPSKIDIGRLAAEWEAEKNENSKLDDFVKSKLSGGIGGEKDKDPHRDVVLYGVGRIGRLGADRKSVG